MTTPEGGPALRPCALCSKNYAETDMVPIGGEWICAACKPRFVQSLAEGISHAERAGARHKRTIVMGTDAVLPDRCIKCNEPAGGRRLRRRLLWHHPALYLLLLINLIVYAIVALVVGKRSTIEVGLCERHMRRRQRNILAIWLALFASVCMVVFGARLEIDWSLALGVFVFLFVLLYAAITTPIVSARKIDKDHIWLAGGGKKFLASLPEWSPF